MSARRLAGPEREASPPTLALAMVLLALLAGCAPGTPRDPAPDPGCRATLRGEELTTILELPGGQVLQGEWSVLGLGPPEGESSGMVADLLLAELSRATSLGAARVSLPFYTPLRLRASAPTAAEALEHVAEVWCNTVLDASLRGLRFDRLVPATRGRIT